MIEKVMNSWTFGGVRLSSLGAVTELDSYLDLPAKRNENAFVPQVDGRFHAKKFFDQKTVSFVIEVTAEDIERLEIKFDTIKQLFGSRSQQYLQYWSPTGIRRAYAEVVAPLLVARDTDALVAKIAVDFLLADPFFRSNILYELETTIDASPHAYDPDNDGTAEVRDAIITFTGPSEHPKIEHQTSLVSVQYNNHLIADDFVVIDCRNFTALLSRKFTNDPVAGAGIELDMPLTSGMVVGNRVLVSSSAGSEYATISVVHLNTHITVNALTLNHTTTNPYVTVNAINSIVHSGDPCFMVLAPGGVNHLHATDLAAGPAGKVKMQYYPPYL
jgi:hypothetical protein